MNLETLDITALPGCPVAERKQLPDRPGIYFVLDGATVLYIGRAVNLRNRWAQHHRLAQVGSAKIAYQEVSDPAMLDAVEIACIDHFQPTLNRTQVPCVNGVIDEKVLYVRIGEPRHREIAEMAQRDDRSITSMVRVLLDEAIAARRGREQPTERQHSAA